MFLVPVTRSSDLARSFDRLFDDTFDRVFGSAGQSVARTPALDVAESDAAYTVTLELPGVAKEDVKVSIDGRKVAIEAQTRRAEERKDGERVLYRERSASSYSRQFSLPQEIDQAESNARMDNGVLTLTLAKKRANGGAQLTIN